MVSDLRQLARRNSVPSITGLDQGGWADARIPREGGVVRHARELLALSVEQRLLDVARRIVPHESAPDTATAAKA